MPADFVKIGTILKPTGVDGELKVDLDDHFEKEFFRSKHFFILLNGDYVPFFVQYVKDSNHLLVKFEDIVNPEQGSQLSLKDLYLREHEILSKSYKGQQQKTGYVGYTVVVDDKVIGTISDILLYPHQVMAQFSYHGEEKIIPLVDDWIQEVNKEKLEINMVLPEGLLDI
jgi:16S rRNA processing protein RimM